MSNTLTCCHCERKFGFTIKQVDIYFHQDFMAIPCSHCGALSIQAKSFAQGQKRMALILSHLPKKLVREVGRVRMLMRYPPVPFEIYGIDIAEAIRQYETVQAAINKVDRKEN